METTQYEYYAFISYKREDEKWAKWLQKKLESYGFPVSLRKDNPSLPSKIRPVFRDQSELSGGNLKEEIEKGLSGSKYLIVICSPRSARSPWVSKEVQYFIDNGKENNIIPFIIGGTPNSAVPEDECFPEGLRQLSGEKEILGININEMGRDAAAIKVIARMFDLRFDSLWQRYKRIKRIKTFIYILIAITLLVITVIIALVMWNKNQTIAEQNDQLTLLIEKLKEENKTVSQIRNKKDQYYYVGSLQGNDGDIWSLNVDFHPYESIVAFSDDWGTWIHYINSNKEVLLPFKGNEYETIDIEGVSFSSDGMELLMSSWGGSYIWNVEDLSLIKFISHDNDAIRDSLINKEFLNFRKSRILIVKNNDINKLSKYTFEFKDDVLSASFGNQTKSTNLNLFGSDSITILKNPVYDEFLFIGKQRAAIFDVKTNEFVQFFKDYDPFNFTFSSNGEYILIGKDIFARKTVETDTIKINSYYISSFGNQEKKVNNDRNTKILSIKNETINYNYNGSRKSIQVIKHSNSGNLQEYVSDALLCNSNKIVAIVEQGNHRVYKASTGELIGRLENYIWIENPLGHEENLCHAHSFILHSQNIFRNLYVVSSGGVIRVYNLDKLTLDRVIVLSMEEFLTRDIELNPVEKCELSDDGKSIKIKLAECDSVFEYLIPDKI